MTSSSVVKTSYLLFTNISKFWGGGFLEARFTVFTCSVWFKKPNLVYLSGSSITVTRIYMSWLQPFDAGETRGSRLQDQTVFSLCCLSQAQRRLSDEESGVWKQPGPAEALKQMLFRLQAVEAELQRQQLPPGASAANQGLCMKEYPVLTNVGTAWPRDKLTLYHVFSLKRFFWMSAVFVLQRPEAGEELESSLGGPSLQRYM